MTAPTDRHGVAGGLAREALDRARTERESLGTLARSELASDTQRASPDHLIVEVFSAIRGRPIGRHISDARALDAAADLTAVTVDLMAAAPPRSHVGLRSNVNADDTAYLALAETYGCPLLTADARLSRAPGVRCDIRVAVATG